MKKKYIVGVAFIALILLLSTIYASTEKQREIDINDKPVVDNISTDNIAYREKITALNKNQYEENLRKMALLDPIESDEEEVEEAGEKNATGELEKSTKTDESINVAQPNNASEKSPTAENPTPSTTKKTNNATEKKNNTGSKPNPGTSPNSENEQSAKSKTPTTKDSNQGTKTPAKPTEKETNDPTEAKKYEYTISSYDESGKPFTKTFKSNDPNETFSYVEYDSFGTRYDVTVTAEGKEVSRKETKKKVELPPGNSGMVFKSEKEAKTWAETVTNDENSKWYKYGHGYLIYSIGDEGTKWTVDFLD